MKRLFVTGAFFILTVSSAFAITVQEEELLVRNTLAVLGRAPLQLPDTFSVPRICGTATLMEAKWRFNELSPQSQAVLRPLLYPRPALQTSYAPASGRFRIHYDTLGGKAVHDANIRNAQNIPVWVDTIGMILDSIWEKEVIQLGFRPPVSDSFYSSNGGDGRRDVYLDALSGGILGYTAPDSAGGVLGRRATAFIVLDNDYAGFPGPGKLLRVTAAHEFHHACQFAYTVYNFEVVSGEAKLYWYEASAVWMEEQVYDDINDYRNYLPFWFRRPELSFRTFSNDFGGDPDRAFRPYAMGIYGLYLSTRFPSYPVVRRVWESMSTVNISVYNLFQAIDSSLGFAGFMPGAVYPQRFLASLREFYQWNYFVGTKRPLNAPDTLYGSESDAWPTFDQYRRVDSTTTYPTSKFPAPMGSCALCPAPSLAFFCSPCSQTGSPCSTRCESSCIYVPYQPSISTICVNDLEDLGASYLNLQYPGGGEDAVFSLRADAGRLAPWKCSAVGYQSGTKTYTFLDSASTNTSQIDSLIWPNFGNHTEIMALVMNAELVATDAPRQNSAYAYFADTTATPTGVEEGEGHRPQSFTLGQNRPNPFNAATVINFHLPTSGQATLEIFNILGQPVRVLLDGRASAGEHSLTWDGKDQTGRALSSGLYLYRLKAGDFSEVKRMLLLK